MTDGNSLVEAQIDSLLKRNGILKIENGANGMMKEAKKNILENLCNAGELRGIDLTVKALQKYRYSFNQLKKMTYNVVSFPISEGDKCFTFLCNTCEFYVIESNESGSLVRLIFLRNK